ncbi:DNA-formamidopyrimidine glycosylase family protein [Candidatus Nitrosocosmicus arcticus]|uniref:DNA-(apurinic or apyrimidinic site) lyase n=1 Tax=Candidatus Nitrosocosmicus arcticus TaxID=2035267 RepID=A0A557STM8_9ARCH|nr:DNA-formamidopyrimidine glycosylase family protein [Candidatus Nitrosocosmicus arcticus]TVP39967.1 putative DNA AP lyase / Formamidopyrimidine-DNA glycosylase [Candidatus Nitrosocosmicus arcticus]
MSEGPEVKIAADKIWNALSGKRIINNILYNKMDKGFEDKIIGSSTEYVKTFGKNIIIKFSSGVYLRNHMMMWGKWRIYDRTEYENGTAKSPPRSSYGKIKHKNTDKIQVKRDEVTDVRKDSRTRLTIITLDKVLVQFNGPILQFSLNDPATMEPIVSLGPDALSSNYNADKVMDIIKSKSRNTDMIISNALLDQKIVSGIGNKYKSEILFLNKIYPFEKVTTISKDELKKLAMDIPRILKYGYENSGKTRKPKDKEKISWDITHWVFRRSGKPCWICGTKIVSERKLTARPTFWCPNCQPINVH